MSIRSYCFLRTACLHSYSSVRSCSLSLFPLKILPHFSLSTGHSCRGRNIWHHLEFHYLTDYLLALLSYLDAHAVLQHCYFMWSGYSLPHWNLECQTFRFLSIGCVNNSNRFNSNSKQTFKWTLNRKDEELLASSALHVITWAGWTIQAHGWVSHSAGEVDEVSYVSGIYRNLVIQAITCSPFSHWGQNNAASSVRFGVTVKGTRDWVPPNSGYVPLELAPEWHLP